MRRNIRPLGLYKFADALLEPVDGSGVDYGPDEDFRQMLKVVTTAKLKPIIDSVISLENARKAMDKMETGEQFGKIVLRVS